MTTVGKMVEGKSGVTQTMAKRPAWEDCSGGCCPKDAGGAWNVASIALARGLSLVVIRIFAENQRRFTPWVDNHAVVRRQRTVNANPMFERYRRAVYGPRLDAGRHLRANG